MLDPCDRVVSTASPITPPGSATSVTQISIVGVQNSVESSPLWHRQHRGALIRNAAERSASPVHDNRPSAAVVLAASTRQSRSIPPLTASSETVVANSGLTLKHTCSSAPRWMRMDPENHSIGMQIPPAHHGVLVQRRFFAAGGPHRDQSVGVGCPEARCWRDGHRIAPAV
jgi:hypothetical protein